MKSGRYSRPSPGKEKLAMATTPKTDTITEPMRITLHGVPWAAYKALRDSEDNNHIRMTYLDGTLELMSPEYVHDKGASRLAMLVRAVADAFGIRYEDVGTTTLRRRRRGKPIAGHARESDASFYFGANGVQIPLKRKIDLRVDPPPDLAIAVDNTTESHWKLKVYARLRVPELWRYDVDAGTLWFGKLGPSGKYEPIEHSAILPMLSRAWVLEVLGRGDELMSSEHKAMLEGWIRTELKPQLP
jgi:Uma2 family endonuclease